MRGVTGVLDGVMGVNERGGLGLGIFGQEVGLVPEDFSKGSVRVVVVTIGKNVRLVCVTLYK